MKTIKELYKELKNKEGYYEDNNLLSHVVDWTLARHMEKTSKDECEIGKCEEYQKELQLVFQELKVVLEEQKIIDNEYK